MRRVLALLCLLCVLSTGCRRHDENHADEVAPESEAHSPPAGVVVDEGCPHQVDGQCSHDADKGSKVEKALAPGLFGKPLGKSPEVPLAEVLSKPERFHEKQVRVEGHVTRACSRKGCWMELAVNSSADAPRCRVTFENYGFFVPKDAAGSRARLEGRVQVTQVKPEAVQHYESEGARFPGKDSDGSAREVRLVATGVELERI